MANPKNSEARQRVKNLMFADHPLNSKRGSPNPQPPRDWYPPPEIGVGVKTYMTSAKHPAPISSSEAGR